MKYILLLSADNLPLAKAEAEAVLHPKRSVMHQRLLLLESSSRDYSRLAYTKAVYRFLFSTPPNRLKAAIHRFSWNNFYEKNFCIRTEFAPRYMEKELAEEVWARLTQPRVDLTNPRTVFTFLFTPTKVFCGQLLFQQQEPFAQRRPHLRPGFHPSSLQPKLARALVNLSRARKGQAVLDSFCGTGGILLEAGLLGCKLVGIELRKDILDKCRQNLEAYHLKARLIHGNALHVAVKADAIVTDLPYGKNTPKPEQNLGEKFLRHAALLLRPSGYAVIMSRHPLRVTRPFRRVAYFTDYVHHTLTRHITVVRRAALREAVTRR